MSFPRDGQECIATGWGCTKYYGRVVSSDVLREVVLPIGSRTQCSRNWRQDYVHEAMICAGLHRGWEGTCPGDSGGPLMCEKPDKSWVQVGITSFGHYRAYNYRDVFTRVSSYVDWIQQTMKKL
ncbi:serine protease 30-like [Tubulanus polymorphus]